MVFLLVVSGQKRIPLRYGLETVKYRALLVWANLPENYNTVTSHLKQKLKHGNVKHVFVGYAGPITRI